MISRSRFVHPSKSDGMPLSTTGAIRLAVSNSGSDGYFAARDAITSGDLTSLPFETIQAALDALPKNINHLVTIELGNGAFAGFQIRGFHGGGFDVDDAPYGIRIIGSGSPVSTAYQSGAAGTGTDSTHLANPSLNWTPNALVGKYLKVTNNPNIAAPLSTKPQIRIIKANTASNAYFDAIPGFDDTCSFEIVDAGTILYTDADDFAMRVECNTAPVELILAHLEEPWSGSFVNAVRSRQNTFVRVSACNVLADATGAPIHSKSDDVFIVDNCNLTGRLLVQSPAKDVQVKSVVASVGGIIQLEDFAAASVLGVEASGCTSNVLRAINGGRLFAEVKANACSATPVYLESVRKFEASGTNKLTGSGNTGAGTYGLEIVSDGAYQLNGCDITGAAGDVKFLGSVVTWTILGGATYGSVEGSPGSASGNATNGKSIRYGNILFDGSMDISGRCLEYGYHNFSANLAPLALSGSTVWEAEPNGVRSALEVNCTSTSARVVLPSNAAIAGCIFFVANVGSSRLTMQAPSGGTITGDADVQAGHGGTFMSLNGNGGKDWFRIA